MVNPMSVIAKVRKLPVDFAIMLMMFYLILGADFAFGENAALMTNVLYMYMFMFVIARVTLPKVEKAQFPLGKAAMNFMAMFIVTAIVMLFLPSSVTALMAAGSFDASILFAVSFGVIYALVKAYIEEDVFRNRISVVAGEKGQAFLFGLFHFFVLVALFGFTTTLIIPIALLMVLGFIWGIMQNKFGTLGSTGSHFGFNAYILGILPRMLGSVV